MATMLPRRKVVLLTLVAVGCGLLAFACLVYAVFSAVTARPASRVGWLPEGSPALSLRWPWSWGPLPCVSASCLPSRRHTRG